MNFLLFRNIDINNVLFRNIKIYALFYALTTVFMISIIIFYSISQKNNNSKPLSIDWENVKFFLKKFDEVWFLLLKFFNMSSEYEYHWLYYRNKTNKENPEFSLTFEDRKSYVHSESMKSSIDNPLKIISIAL